MKAIKLKRDLELAGCAYANAKGLKATKKKQVVHLVREPENGYDRNAVRVEDAKGRKLGYVPMAWAEVFAALMDAGHTLHAVVSDPHDQGFVWIDILMDAKISQEPQS